MTFALRPHVVAAEENALSAPAARRPASVLRVQSQVGVSLSGTWRGNESRGYASLLAPPAIPPLPPASAQGTITALPVVAVPIAKVEAPSLLLMSIVIAALFGLPAVSAAGYRRLRQRSQQPTAARTLRRFMRGCEALVDLARRAMPETLAVAVLIVHWFAHGVAVAAANFSLQLCDVAKRGLRRVARWQPSQWPDVLRRFAAAAADTPWPRRRRVVAKAVRLAVVASAMIGVVLPPVPLELFADTVIFDSNNNAGDGATDGAGPFVWVPGTTPTFYNGTGTLVATTPADVAQFGNGGTLGSAATINVSTGSIHGLIFGPTVTNGYVLTADTASQILSLGAGGVVVSSGAAATTLGSANLSLALTADQTWLSNSANALNVNGAIDLGTRTLTISGTAAGSQVFNAGISGSGGVVVNNTSTGTTTFNAANSYSGATAVRGGTLNVAGSGTIASTAVTLSGGKLVLNRSSVTTAMVTAATAALTTGYGGEFSVTNNSTATNEAFASWTLSGGYSTLTSSGSATSIIHHLAIGSGGLTRNNYATALVRGTNLSSSATNSTHITIDGTNGTGLTLIGAGTSSSGNNEGTDKTLRIVPYLVGDTSATGTGSGFVTYDTNATSGGLRPLGTNEYASLAADYTTAAIAENVRLTANTPLATSSSVVVNSLSQNSGPNLILNSSGSGGANTIVVQSGAVGNFGSGTMTIGSSFAGLTLGSGAWNQGIVTVGGSGALMINTPISVNNGGVLVKSGAGQLTLAAANLYDGLVINAGTVSIGADSALGVSGGDVTFDGNGTLAVSAGNVVLGADRTVTLNSGVQGTFSIGSLTGVGIAGKITGAGGINFIKTSSATGVTIALSNTANDFQGPLGIGNNVAGGALTVSVAGLADSATANGDIRLGSTTTTGSGTISWDAAATTALTLNNRSINLVGSTGGGTIDNSNANTANTITVNKNLIVSGTGAKTLTLQGGNLGNNTFAGNIANGAGASTIALTKAGAGLWILDGTNTYTGATSISAGYLVLGKTAALSPGSAVTVAANTGLGLRVGGTGFFSSADVDALFAGTFVTMNATSRVGIDTTAGDFLYETSQTSTRALFKTGTGTLTLSGTNSFSGVLVFDGTVAVSGSGTLGGATSAITLNGGRLNLGGTTQTVGAVSIVNPGTGGDTLFNGTLLGTGYAVSNAAGTVTISANLGATTAAFNKSGAGTVVLGGTNTYTGATTISNGVLRVTGSTVMSTTSAGGATALAGAAGSRAVLDVPTGGSYTTLTLGIGAGANSIGSLVIRGGDVNVSSTTNNTGSLVGSAGHSSLFMSGGTFKTRRFDQGVSTVTTGTISVVQLTGGTFNWTEYVLFRAQRTDFLVHGANMIRTGTVNLLAMAEGANSIGVLSVTGGVLNNAGQDISFGRAVAPTATGILNINNGILTTNGFALTPANFGAGYLNFNGGTLRANVNDTAFLPAGLTAVRVNGAFGSFNGGAVIDSAGRDITVAADLLAPTGQGVRSLSLASAGSDYIGVPYVEIIGDGTGATASAIVDLDPAGATYGKVTGLIVTNPGVGYTTATVNILGGGGTGASATTTLGDNTSGGLTKLGAGVLTLSGTNTYSGKTILSEGGISFSTSANLGDGSQTNSIEMGDATVLRFTGGTVDLGANRSITLASGSGTIDVTGTSLTVPSISIPSFTKSGAGSLILTGAHSFATATTVSGGILRPAENGELGDLTLSGGQLDLNGTTQTAGAVAITAAFVGGETLSSGTLSGTSYAVSNTTGNVIVSTALGGSAAGLTKTGAGTLTLSGASTFGGPTVVQAGNLVVSSFNSVVDGTAASNLGAPTSVLNGTITLGNLTTAVTLRYEGTGETTDRVLDLVGTTGGITLEQAGTGLLKFSSGILFSGAGSKMLTLQGSTAGSGEIVQPIVDNSLTNKTSLTKAGTGAWTLSGANTYTGGTTVSGGTLNITGSWISSVAAAFLQTGGTVNVSGTVHLGGGSWTSTSTTKSVTNFLNGSNTNVLHIGTGFGTNAVGAMNIAAGASLTQTGTESSTLANFSFGFGANAYGYLNMSGGTVTVVRLLTGSSGAGVAYVSGGTIKVTEHILLGRGASPGSTFTLAGGTIDHSTGIADPLSIGLDATTGVHVLNILGGQFLNPNRALDYQGSNPTTTMTGILNLNGGTLTVTNVERGSVSNGTALFNFNGGTLVVGPNSADAAIFMPEILTGAYVYSGGAKIDTNGNTAVTIAQSLLKPEGKGVTTITLDGNTGSGYIGAPHVVLSGGDGIGATAIANMVDDGTGNGTFRIGSVTITNPGTGYTAAPTVTLIGGGATTAAVTTGWTPALADNTSGGLTKLGVGVLTLGGTNTYSGKTILSEGGISFSTSANLGDGSAANSIEMAGGTLLRFTGGTVDLGANRSITLASGSGTIDVTGTSLTVPSVSIPSFTKSGAGALILTGSHSFATAVTVSGGLLSLATAGPLGDLTLSGVLRLAADGTVGNVTLSGGQLDLNGTTQTAGTVAVSALFGAAEPITAGTLNAASFTFSNNISYTINTNLGGATATLTKPGTGTLRLGGTNTYGGGTSIGGGTLEFASDAALGSPSSAVSFASGTTLRALGTTTAARNITAAGTLNIDVPGAAHTYTVGQAFTVGGAVTKTGAGTLAFSQPLNMLAQDLIVNNGVLKITNDMSNFRRASSYTGFLIGNAALSAGVGGGAVVQTGGNVTGSSGTAANNFAVGAAANSFGSYVISGGSYTTTMFNTGVSGTGVITVLNGGTLNSSHYFLGGRAATGVGSFTLAGGSYNVVGSGWTGSGVYGGGRLELNIGVNLGGANQGGSFNMGAIGYTMNGDNVLTSRSFVNLAGGTFNVNSVSLGDAVSGIGMTQFNFHGGTLRYGGTNATQAAFMPTAAGFAAYVYGEGAVIDDAGKAITIAQHLLAPDGSGVQSIAVSGGSGYYAAPYVKIEGGNNDAAAVAKIDSAGNVTEIIIVNPGTGYSSAPTVTLVGGTAGTAATATATLNSGNSSGGLTKIGSGTLTLSGNSTYAGGTTVAAGTLTLSGSLNPATVLNVGSASAPAVFNLATAVNQTVAGINFGSANATSTAQGSVTLSGTSSLSLAGPVAYLAAGNPLAAVISGTGTLKLDGDVVFNVEASTNASLSITGGADLTISSVVADGTSAGGITKNGTGVLHLSNANNTFTGPLTINNGTLQMNRVANGAVTVGTAGTLATLHLSNVNPPTGTDAAHSVTDLTLGDHAAISFTLGAANSNPLLRVTGNLALAPNTATKLNFATGTGYTGVSAVYTLIQADNGGLSGAESSKFIINGLLGGMALSLGSTTNALLLNATAHTGEFYWKGDLNPDKNWSTVIVGGPVQSNWTTDADGLDDIAGTPGIINEVIFSADDAQNAGASVIDIDMALKALTISGNSAATTQILGGDTVLTLGAGVGGTTIKVDNGVGLTLGSDTIGSRLALALTTGAKFFNNTSGLLDIRGDITSVATSGTQTLTIDGPGNTTLAGVLGNGATGGKLALTKTGLGKLTLGAVNNFTGATTVNQGVLQVTGTLNNGTTAGVTSAETTNSPTLAIGFAAGSGGVVDVPTGGTLNTTMMGIANVAGASGVLTIRGGDVLTMTATSNLGIIAGSTGSYAGIFLLGGTLDANRIDLIGTTAGTSAMLRVSGGTLSVSDFLIFRHTRYEFTVTGGTVTHRNGAGAAVQSVSLGYSGATGVMTVAGGTVNNSGQSVIFGEAANSPTGTLNLNAGNLLTNTINRVRGTATVNLNGGTLTATANGALIPNTPTAVYVNGAFGAFGGGAVIDTSGRDVSIDAALLAPAGNGIRSIAVTTAGTGYIGAPYVQINDATGTGATAYANVDLDPGSATYGQLLDIVVSNPGVNYSSAPTFTLIGGSGTGTVLAATVGANSSGGLTKTGLGSLTLSGNNTFTGGITLNAGTLNINHASALGTGRLTIAAGTTINNSTTGALALSTNNAQTWNGNFTFTGTNNLTFGTGAVTLGADVQLTVAGSSVLGLGGAVGGSFGLAKAGTGTLLLTGQSTYAGNTSIAAGTLQAGIVDALPHGTGKGNVAVAGTFDLNGFAQTVNGLSGAGLVDNLQTGTATLTVGDNNQSSTFDGTLQNSGSGASLALTKVGGGTFTLAGANNTYSGPTLVQGGTLNVTGTKSGSGGVTVQDGGTLTGSGSIAGLTTVHSGGTLLAALDGLKTLALGALTLEAGALLNFDLAAGSTADLVQVAGLLTLDAGSITLSDAALNGVYSLFQFGSFSGAVNNFTVANQQAGKSYAFTLDGGFVKLTIDTIPAGNYWAPAGSGGGTGSWAAGSNVWAENSGEEGTRPQATTGALLFAGATGTVTVTGTVTAAAGLTFSTTGYTIQGGTIQLTGSTAQNNLTVNDGLAATISSNLAVTNGLTKSGPGQLTLSGNNDAAAIHVAGGTLTVSGNLASGAGLTIDENATAEISSSPTLGEVSVQGTAQFSGSAVTVATLNGTLSTGSVHLGTNTVLTVGQGTFEGTLHGGPNTGLVKNTAGQFTLNGSNANFSGTTTVSAGTLTVASPLTGSVYITGGTLDGVGAEFSNVVVTGGNQQVNGEQQGSTTVDGGTTTVNTGGSLSGDVVVADGTLNLNGGSVTTNSFIQSGGTVTVGAGGTVTQGATVTGGAFNVQTGGEVQGTLALSGTGRLQGSGGTVEAAAFAPGAVLAVGNSVGHLTIGPDEVSSATSLSFAAGSNIVFEFMDVDAGAGIGWDAVTINGGNVLIGAGGTSQADTINLYINSLDGDTPGPAAGFLATKGVQGDIESYYWKFIGVADLSQIMLSGANDLNNVNNRFTIYDAEADGVFYEVGDPNGNPFERPVSGLGRGTFTVVAGNYGEQGNGLYIHYSAVPEPGSLLLAGLGSLGAAWYGKRRRKNAAAQQVDDEPTAA